LSAELSTPIRGKFSFVSTPRPFSSYGESRWARK
jgi:hypothetical protein